MADLRIIILACFTLTGCGDGGSSPPPPPPPPPPPDVISMAPQDWMFSPAGTMPVQSPSPAAEGWYFDFPRYDRIPTTDCLTDPACQRAGYLTTRSGMNLAAKTIVMVFKVEVEGAPVFQYKLNPDNTCENPASVKVFLQQRGDNMSGQGAYQYFRWWSNPAGAYLEPRGVSQLMTGGIQTVQVPITPDQWTSVYGKRGDQDAEAMAGIAAAITNLGNIGVTFGGGCFAGHGVNVGGGTARFTMIRFYAQ